MGSSHCRHCGYQTSGWFGSEYGCARCYQNNITRQTAQREHEYEVKMAEMKQEAEQTRADIEARAQAAEVAAEVAAREANNEERQRERDHEMKLKECDQDHEVKLQERDQVAQKEALKNLDNFINSFARQCDEWDKKLSETEVKLVECEKRDESLSSECVLLKKKLEDMKEEHKNRLDIAKNEVSNLEEELGKCDNKMDKMIEQTCVNQDNCYHFLKLIHKLSNATRNDQIEIEKLASKLNTFRDLILRISTNSNNNKSIMLNNKNDLTIKEYFTQNKKERLIELFENEDLYFMKDITCDTDDEYKDMINEVIIEPLKAANKDKLKRGETKFLERVCKQPEIWKKEFEESKMEMEMRGGSQQVGKDPRMEKEEISKNILINSSPLFCKFFERMFKAVEQAQSLLTYDSELNNQQKQEIERIKKRENWSKLYKNFYDNKNENNDNGNNSNNKNNENNNSNDKPEIETKNGTCDDDDDDIDDDIDDGQVTTDAYGDGDGDRTADSGFIELLATVKEMNLLEEEYKENVFALREAAITKINVIESLSNDINDLTKDHKDGGSIALIEGIQASCLEIFKSQADMRTSIILAQEICKYRPANGLLVSNESKALWNGIDNGIIKIFENAMILNKSCYNYFGYFLKFQHAFRYFLNGNSQNYSLIVSTEYIETDINSFVKFSDIFMTQVEALNKEAMTCIRQCIENTIGYESFKATENEKMLKNEKLIKAKKEYNELLIETNNEYNELFKQATDKKCEYKQNKLKSDYLKIKYSRQTEINDELIKSKQKLEDTKTNMIAGYANNNSNDNDTTTTNNKDNKGKYENDKTLKSTYTRNRNDNDNDNDNDEKDEFDYYPKKTHGAPSKQDKNKYYTNV